MVCWKKYTPYGIGRALARKITENPIKKGIWRLDDWRKNTGYLSSRTMACKRCFANQDIIQIFRWLASKKSNKVPNNALPMQTHVWDMSWWKGGADLSASQLGFNEDVCSFLPLVLVVPGCGKFIPLCVPLHALIILTHPSLQFHWTLTFLYRSTFGTKSEMAVLILFGAILHFLN